MSWLRLFRWELYKVTHARSSYLGFVLCLLFCVLVLVVFAYSQIDALEDHARDITANARAYVNGYFYATFVLYFGDKALLPLLAGLIPGAQLAGEARDGTLRAMLTRPLSRPAVFVTKLAVSYVWLLVTIYFFIALALALGLIFMGRGDFLVFAWEFRRYGAWIAEESDWLYMFLLSGFGASLGLFWVVALSMSLSALTDNPVVAYVGALGTFFISSIIQRLPEQLLHPGIKGRLPTTHMGFWHELYWLFSPYPERLSGYRLVSDVKWCALYSVVFLAAGFLVFARKDIKS